MSRYQINNYKSIISFAIVAVLIAPIALDVDKGVLDFEKRERGYEDTTPFEIVEVDQNEKVVPSSSQYRDTRSLETEYLSFVDYNDVLIVRNNNSAISMEIADYFKEKRNIPDINVCNISTSTGETISRTVFENEIRTPIENYLTNNGLLGTINYIVTTKGVPLRISEVDTSNNNINWPNTYDRSSVDSELTIILGSYSGYIGGEGPMMPFPPPSLMYIQNPYYNDYVEFSQSDYEIFLVTRLTGFYVTQIKSYIDKVPEAVGIKGTFVFDEEPARGTTGNDWIQNANATLTAKGFNVIHNDQSNTFLTNNENVSGYTSWGSNDNNWAIGVNTNYGFETGSILPDNWYINYDMGNDEIDRNNTDKRYGSWSVRINRSVANDNYSAISQNVTIKPDTRYFLRGYVNVSDVSGGKGAHLRIRAYNSLGQLVWEQNGSAKSGTTNSWYYLNQIIFEPIEDVTIINVSAILSEASGEAFFDDIRLVEIRPHNSWLPGALVETYVSTGGRSFNYPTTYGQSQVADLILDGVSGTKGYVWEPYLSACAHPDILFDTYTDGYYSAESYYMASEFLSWMDIVVCDPKLAVYKQSMIPDLAITPLNISFSDSGPITGETINIYADVQNLGNYTASDVVVHFYAGDPALSGTLIGEAVLDVSPHNNNQTYIVWNTTGYVGDHDIYVVVDAIDRYYELSENNNKASAKITILNGYGLGLEQGWNLISLPLAQMNTSLSAVLESISGDYDDLRYYNSSDGVDLWKHHHESKPALLNDLTKLNHSIGFWIHIVSPGGTTLNVKGFNFSTSQSISLHKGWNLVGYPSLTSYNRTDGLNNTEFGAHFNVIYWYDASSKIWHNMQKSDYFERGRGYWVHAREEVVWQVPV